MMLASFSSKHDLKVLDGIRGIAAICVFLYHSIYFVPLANLFYKAYLAVDLFFILSGFVLARAYDDPILSGMTFSEFLWRRGNRLYPMYAVGIVIGAFGLGGAMMLGSAVLPSVTIYVASVVFNTFLIPLPSTAVGHGQLFPINPAAWSIFFELIANAIYFGVRRCLNGQGRDIILLVCLATIVATAVVNDGLDVGSGWSGFLGALFRASFGFLLGTRLSAIPRGPQLPSSTGWLLLAFCLVIFSGPITAAPVIYDVVAAAILFPSIIYLGSSVRSGRRSGEYLDSLGAISYPLYIIHTPLLFLLVGATSRMWHFQFENSKILVGLSITIAIVFASAMSALYIDLPIQRALHARRKAQSVLNAGPIA